MTLYEIGAEYLQVLEMMQDPEIDPEVLSDTMEAIEGELEIKADSYVVVAKELEAEADKLQTEIDRLTKRRDTCLNNRDNIKKGLFNIMIGLGKTKLSTEHFKFSIVKNGGLQPMKITGEVPAEFCKLEPDNKLIREALATGELPFAHLEDRGTHLSIK